MAESPKSKLAELITDEIDRRKLSTNDVARMMSDLTSEGTRISRQTVTRWKARENTPSPTNLLILSRALGIDLQTLRDLWTEAERDRISLGAKIREPQGQTPHEGSESNQDLRDKIEEMQGTLNILRSSLQETQELLVGLTEALRKNP